MSERRLPDQMLIANAVACQAMLLQWLDEEDSPLVLNGQDVSQIDTSGVQILLAASLSSKRNGRSLLIERCSEPLHKILAFAGVLDLFLRGSGEQP